MTNPPIETKRIFVVVGLELHKHLARLAIDYDLQKVDVYLLCMMASMFGVDADYAIKDYVSKRTQYTALQWCEWLAKEKNNEHKTETIS